jgi:hypothetical protein
MFGIYFRVAWRLLIFLLGITLAFGVIDRGVPYLHRYMPIGLVFLVVYLVSAYVAIPALIRLWRLVIKPNHLPVYATTGDGWASDPVNIAVICRSREHLISCMRRAGWSVAAKGGIVANLRTGYAIFRKKAYPEATMSRLFLFNRSQDIGFQLQDGDSPSPRHRHHVRFWKLETPVEADDHHDFWHLLLRLFKRKRSEIWIGAATHDVRLVAIRMRNLQITHLINSDTNSERDYLIDTLTSSGCLKDDPENIASGHELKFRGQTFGVNIIVDGRLKVIHMKGRL